MLTVCSWFIYLQERLKSLDGVSTGACSVLKGIWLPIGYKVNQTNLSFRLSKFIVTDGVFDRGIQIAVGCWSPNVTLHCSLSTYWVLLSYLKVTNFDYFSNLHASKWVYSILFHFPCWYHEQAWSCCNLNKLNLHLVFSSKIEELRELKKII